jgi:hypothetical protein
MGETAHKVVHDRHTRRTGGPKVTRHYATHIRFLGRLEQRALRVERGSGAEADKEVDALQEFCELVRARGSNVKCANFDALRFPLLQKRGRRGS